MRAVARIGPAKDEHFLPLCRKGEGELIQKKEVKNTHTQTEGCGKKSPYQQGGTNNVTCFNSPSRAKRHLFFSSGYCKYGTAYCTCHSWYLNCVKGQ